MNSLIADYDLRIEGTSETAPVVYSSIAFDTLLINQCVQHSLRTHSLLTLTDSPAYFSLPIVVRWTIRSKVITVTEAFLAFPGLWRRTKFRPRKRSSSMNSFTSSTKIQEEPLQ